MTTLKPASYRGAKFLVDGEPKAVLGASRLYDQGRNLVRAIDVDADLVIHLGAGRPIGPICCKVCEKTVRPIDIETQVREFLRSRFYERNLRDTTLQAEMIASIAPWFDRFRAGEDLCFDCGVKPVSNG